MSKRGDKKRKKKKRLAAKRKTPYEGFQMGPLIFERYGRMMVQRLDPDHPDAANFRQLMLAAVSAAPDRTREIRDEIVHKCASLDAFDVLAHIWLMNVPMNPETFAETSHEGRLAACEWAAATLASRDGRLGSEPGAEPSAELLLEIQGLLDELIELELMSAMFGSAKADETPSDFDHVRAMASAHRSTVRGPSYSWQEHETVLELFDAENVRDDVRTACGFSAPTAMKLADAVVDLGLARYVERAEIARTSTEALIQDLHRSRNDKELLDKNNADFVEMVGSLDIAEASERLRRISIAWLGLASGTTMSFTVDELVEFSECDPEETAAFLEQHSVDFAQTGPVGIEGLRYRPIMRDADGNYLCFSQHNLWWGVRQSIENALKLAGGKAFQKYEKHRSSTVEGRAVHAIVAALGADWSHRSLHYERDSKDGKKEFEIDGLVRCDSALFVIEAKASSMRASAKRAAALSFKDWLTDEVSYAATQARRTTGALAGQSDPATLFDDRGNAIDVDLTGIRHVFEVVVTLEDLPAVAPSTWLLADAGILPSDPIPWLVSLHELELICDLVETPSEFVHYLLRRRRMDSARRAWAADELDYFMHYLKFGLYWPDRDPAEPPVMEQLASFTDDLDAWFMYKRGERKKRARKPSPRHRADVKELLDCLNDLSEVGRLDASLLFLDVDTKTRKKIVDFLRTLKHRSALDKRWHDATLIHDHGGITIMTCPPTERHDLAQSLGEYVMLKQHQMEADTWLGLGAFEGPPELAQCAVILTEPWQPDPELDAIVGSLPTAGREGNFDGRIEARRRKNRREVTTQ